MNKRQFIVLAENKEFFPMAFITPNDEGGKIRADNYAKKMTGSEQLVIVELQYVQNYN